jgi:peroxiredoxin
MLKSSPIDAPLGEEKTRATLPFAVFLVLILGSYFTLKVDQINRPTLKPASDVSREEPQAPAAGPMTGRVAPEFGLPSIGGGTVKLSDLKGKLVFMNIWATWCAPCRDEMPSMERLYQKLKGPNFEMIAISVDEEGKTAVDPFAEELGLTFPILLDPEKNDSKDYKPEGVAKRYMITGVPETYLIRQDGLVILHLVGPTEWDRPEIVDVIKKLADDVAEKR